MAQEFVPALELSEGFYRDVVEPVVHAWPHAAALLGTGSELLGFDTQRSTDHGWGPRLQVFVAPQHVDDARGAIDGNLPTEYRGRRVAFGWDDVPTTHHVEVATLDGWLHAQLGCNPLHAMTPLDWLLIPQQRLLGVVRGAVYHDEIGTLTATRQRLAYFPADVRMWMLACQWRRIDQDEPFVGRTAEVGDETGSRLSASRIVRDLMRLHFVLAGRYWPYAKWFGSAYRQLPASAEMLPGLDAALNASDYPAREIALVDAYEATARLHNASSLTETLDPTVAFFYERPFRVLRSDRFVRACLARVDDEWLRTRPLIGSIDQFVDATDLIEDTTKAHVLRALYVDGP